MYFSLFGTWHEGCWHHGGFWCRMRYILKHSWLANISLYVYVVQNLWWRHVSCVHCVAAASSLGTWSRIIYIGQLCSLGYHIYQFGTEQPKCTLHASFKVHGAKTNTPFKSNTCKRLPTTNIWRYGSNFMCSFHCSLIWNSELNNIGQICSIGYNIQIRRSKYTPTRILLRDKVLKPTPRSIRN